MISRQRSGITKPGLADAYMEHLEHDTFVGLEKLDGFIRASILKRDIGDMTEFQIVTEWESLDSIRAFAGADVSVAIVPEAARALLASFDDHVRHYQVERTFEPR
jgi:heme-degrading monooxygenase HmoA